MKPSEFDKAQPVMFDEVRPGDMVAMSGVDEAKEVEKYMLQRSLGQPPRVWITWAGWKEAEIYPAKVVVFVCMD